MAKTLPRYLLYFMILVYVSGAIGFFFAPDFFRPFTPYTLILTAFVFLAHQEFRSKSYLLSMLVIALLTLMVEVVGVQTGWVFGAYEYGNSLGPKIAGVPWIIAVNWALLINCVVLTAARFTDSKVVIALLSAVFITVFDVLMEAVAPGMDMWYFFGGIAGYHNYAAWFLITFLMAYFFQTPLKQGNPKVALLVLSLQFLVFVSVFFTQLYTNQS